MEPTIHSIFEPTTGTWQYIVADPSTVTAAIIDPVLDFDPSFSRISTVSAEKLLTVISSNNYTVTHILETHAHADHLTASNFLQRRLADTTGRRPDICIGTRIRDVQAVFGARYGIPEQKMSGVFDRLWDDGETFMIGDIQAKILDLPGHTPDHIGYLVGSNVFTGDSIFNADVGSARCDFPGGSATKLYSSIQKLLSLPEEYKLYTGHDYPPDGREEGKVEKPYCTVAEQRRENKHANAGVKESEFVQWRTGRDAQLAEPKLIHQALQVNVRAGRLPEEDGLEFRFFKVPVKVPKGVL